MGFFVTLLGIVKQIVERKYAKSIPNGYRTILCYGVAFCEKDCLIKLLRV